MGLQSRGGIPTIEWERVVRATEPKLRGPVPAMNTPVQNANFILNKATLTLNRAGSHPGNPILAGLGVRNGHQVGRGSRLTGIFLFQDRRVQGTNLVAQATSGGPGIFLFDFMAGSGQSVAGSPSTGAVRNFLRWMEPGGETEKEFWVKTKDADIVALDGQPALDPSTLLPVERAFQIVDASRDWLDVPIDFFVSWADEFLELHRQVQGTPENGFMKAYGGAAFVSFFDTTPGTEGIGVQVNPVTDLPIKDQHVIQVENTAGLKEITVRFRSKASSIYFVDVPILIRVLAAPADDCHAPFSEPCSSVYLKTGTALPDDCPAIASTPAVQVVAGTPGDPLLAALLVITVHGTTVGASPLLRVRKLKWVANAQALAGADLVQVGTDEEYLPLVLDGDSPVEAPPYGDPHRLTVAFSVTQLHADLVAFLVVSVKDGDHIADPIVIPGPRARDISFMALGGSGGGSICSY